MNSVVLKAALVSLPRRGQHEPAAYPRHCRRWGRSDDGPKSIRVRSVRRGTHAALHHYRRSSDQQRPPLAELPMKRSPTFWLYIRDAPGGEGHRDYFSRSLNALRNARNVSRIKSACVDTSFSTQSEPRPLAASSSSLSTPSNNFSYASSQMRPFSLLNSSTRSLVALIRSAAASTSGVTFGVSGVAFGVASSFAAALLAGAFAAAFLAGAFAAAFLAGAFAAAFLAGAFAAAFLA